MTSKDEINNDLLEMLNHTKEMLEMLCEGFKRNNLDSLGKVEALEKNLYKDSESLFKSLLDEKTEEGINHFIPVPEHFNRIGNGLRKMLNAIDKKVTGDVLFSDKSVTEAYKLFSELQELLTCLGDCINTCNRVLVDHICDRVKGLCERADEYAIFHEDRLISGVCTPLSAPIYLDILDSFKSIAWHTGEITRNIAKGCNEN
jgi:Na+/phosphate symporter